MAKKGAIPIAQGYISDYQILSHWAMRSCTFLAMKKCNGPKSFFFHLKPNKSLGVPDASTGYSAIGPPGPAGGPECAGPCAACYMRVPEPSGQGHGCTIYLPKVSAKRSDSNKNLAGYAQKKQKGASCECKKPLGSLFNVCQRTPFEWDTEAMMRNIGGMHLGLMMRSKTISILLTSQEEDCQILTDTLNIFLQKAMNNMESIKGQW